ncbi:MAG TPA: glycosyltransferase family 39 protein [Kineosporiaceae bacterium]
MAPAGASGVSAAPAAATAPVSTAGSEAAAVSAVVGRRRPGSNVWAAPDDPRSTRPALLGLLLVTAVAYLWDLGRNGWGNSFYAAAVQSGTKSWSSLFFGSLDWGDYITVDKPPVSLWIMSLSGRIFGFSAWSMLAPEALLGVASVALLFASVRRVWGASAGLLAGALLAITPAAALMFRFNNPDAALTFLLVAAAYALTRSLERASLRWLLLCAALIGTAFLAKSLQAFLVVPGLGLAYLVAAPASWIKRIAHLVGALAMTAVSSLWWPLLVDSLPASSRPYVGGSTTDSVLELAVGYNGLSRIIGGDGPGGGGGFGGAGFGGAPGLGRLFNDQFAGFVAWFVPAALIGLLAAVWLTAGARRADPRWGSIVLWGGWTFVTAGVFSFMSGIVHSYYTVALAPGVAALAGMVVPPLWRRRNEPGARSWLALMAAASVITAYRLLGTAPHWHPWLRVAVLVTGLAGVAVLLLPGGHARLPSAGAILALAASVAAPSAWSVATVNSTHTGGIPTVGPTGAGMVGVGGGPGLGGPGLGGPGLGGPGLGGPGLGGPGFGGPGFGGAPRADLFPSAAPGFPEGGQVPNGGVRQRGGFRMGRPVGPGGGTADRVLVALLKEGAAGYRWAAATPSSMSSAPLQLATDVPVMALGGFGGGDPAITLAQFQADVAARRIHYYLGGGGFGGPGGGGPRGRGAIGRIAEWVSVNFAAKTVGNTTVYDLSAPLSPTG